MATATMMKALQTMGGSGQRDMKTDPSIYEYLSTGAEAFRILQLQRPDVLTDRASLSLS